MRQRLQNPSFIFLGILLLSILVRCYNITMPPIEQTHGWRQCFTADVTKNQFQGKGSLTKPVVSYGNNGQVASEFPLFNSLSAWLSKPFGSYYDWIGRVVNLIITSLGCWVFFLLIKNWKGPGPALLAGVLLIFSCWFMYSRKIMPDTFSVSLILMGVYALDRFINSKSYWYLPLGVVLVLLGALSKLPALLTLGLLLIPLLDSSIGVRRKAVTLLLLIIPVSLAYWWYFIYSAAVLESGGVQLFWPKDLAKGWEEFYPLWDRAAEKIYFSAMSSFVGFGIVVIGLIAMIRTTAKRGLIAVTVSFIGLLLYGIKTGIVFPLHEYYIIPFVPLLCYVASFSPVFLKKKTIIITVLSIFVVEAFLNQQHDLRWNSRNNYLVELENTIAPHVSPNDKIVVNGGLDPSLIYFSNHTGWSLEHHDITTGKLAELKSLGAAYVLIGKNYGNNFPVTALINDDNISLYPINALLAD